MKKDGSYFQPQRYHATFGYACGLAGCGRLLKEYCLDIFIPLTHKVISPKSIHGEIILGKEEGRTSEKEITLFK